MCAQLKIIILWSCAFKTEILLHWSIIIVSTLITTHYLSFFYHQINSSWPSWVCELHPYGGLFSVVYIIIRSIWHDKKIYSIKQAKYQGNCVKISCWNHNLQMFSTSLALCEGNPPVNRLLMIWDWMMLMWYQCTVAIEYLASYSLLGA